MSLKTENKENQVYEYIKETIARVGYPPSTRDIQKALGIGSTSTVHTYLKHLEERELIQKDGRTSRSLRISETVSEPKRSVKVPIVGQVAAGTPILAVENIEGYFDFPLLKRSYMNCELFALRVKGESMIEAGILDGDIIIVRQTPTAENGEIIVALVDDSATVKTFYKENGHFRLQPENKTMKPIIVDSLLILGKVISVMRLY